MLRLSSIALDEMLVLLTIDGKPGQVSDLHTANDPRTGLINS